MTLNVVSTVPKVLSTSLICQEWVKLRISNLAGTFTGSIQKKPIKISELIGPHPRSNSLINANPLSVPSGRHPRSELLRGWGPLGTLNGFAF